MPAKLVLLHARSREGVLAGVNLLADAVRRVDDLLTNFERTDHSAGLQRRKANPF